MNGTDIVHQRGVQEGIRIGRKAGFRQGVAATLCAGVVTAAIVVVALPEGRGKAQELVSRARRQARDAAFRFRNRGNAVPDESE